MKLSFKMGQRFSGWATLFGMLCLLAISGGCFGQKRPSRPALSPKQSAEEAMAAYDANSDGFIDADEVEESPGLKAAFERVDKDGDGKVSPEEIAKRIEYYKTARTAIISGAASVTLNKRPLPGATVTFEPESFLGESFKPCSGVTDEFGVANVSGHDATFSGIYLGFYRVRISKEVKGKEYVPSKYNTETEIGYEAAEDIPLVASSPEFNLRK